MTLYLIGIGLNDEKDISLRGLEAVKICKYVYLESYTSKLNCDVSKLEKLYGKKIVLADRNLVEKNADDLLEKAEKDEVAFLVIGDVFSATTHTDLRLRALEKKIKIKVIHNTSILTAVGDTGLELYKFGKTTSIPFENENVETPYDVIKENKDLHTLILLDLRPKENRFMAVKDAIEFLLRVEKKRKEGILADDKMVVGCSGLGSDDEVIKYSKAKDLIKEDFGQGLHCIIIPGKLHFMEEDILKLFKI